MSACADAGECPEATPPQAGAGRWWARGSAILRKMFMRSLWVLLGLAVLVVLTLLRLRSDLHDALGPLGPRLSNAGMLTRLVDQEFPDSAEERILVLNGQRLTLSTRMADEPLNDALRDSLADCPTRQELGEPVTSNGRGYTICLHPSDHLSNGPSLTSRIQSFGQTLDMSNLGSFEYVYGERHGDRTVLLTLRSTDDLNVEALVPAEGDAPGTELADFPRPPEGRRLLQSYEEGQPYRLTIYSRSSRSTAELTRWYQEHVDHQVWHEADLERQAQIQGVELEADHGLIFWRNENLTRFTLVSFDERPAEDDVPAGTTVTVAEAL
ncbi:MAG: hypothetical protein GXP55_04330 [Deltaproteobacteria bacterium]|nr:hypothetical protein [Deltaproteobacteria bacterium]